MYTLLLMCALASVQENAAAPRTITIGVNDSMKYSVTSISAKPGETIRVVLQSTSTLKEILHGHTP